MLFSDFRTVTMVWFLWGIKGFCRTWLHRHKLDAPWCAPLMLELPGSPGDPCGATDSLMPRSFGPALHETHQDSKGLQRFETKTPHTLLCQTSYIKSLIVLQGIPFTHSHIKPMHRSVDLLKHASSSETSTILQHGNIWATVNIWYVALSSQFLVNVLSFSKFWECICAFPISSIVF